MKNFSSCCVLFCIDLTWETQRTLVICDFIQNRCTRHKAQTTNDTLDPYVRPHNPYLLETRRFGENLQQSQIEPQFRIMLEPHIDTVENPDPRTCILGPGDARTLNFIDMDLDILEFGTVFIQILGLGRRRIVTSLANMVKIVVTGFDNTLIPDLAVRGPIKALVL